MIALIGFLLIFGTILSIEVQLRKGNKQKEEIIGLLQQIKDAE